MRVQLVDPSAYTPPYDYGLARGLALAGADVEVVTSRYIWGHVPEARGFRVSEQFYRRTMRRDRHPRVRQALKLAEHLPDMWRFRRYTRAADVRHYEWLPLELLDTALLPPARPRVLTVHNVRKGTLHSLRLRDRLALSTTVLRRLARQMDALVVHTRDGVEYLTGELGAPPDRVHHIPHGAFDYLTELGGELPPELRDADGPVILFFGALHPYKGLDVLLEAFACLEGAELWIVGRPLMPLEPLLELAKAAPGRVRFVNRFVPDEELAACIRRAQVVVLPYRSIDQSGVLHAAMPFGKAIVLSAVGGFLEVVEEHGAGRLVPPNDHRALADALRALLDDPAERERLGLAAARAAAGPYSWTEVGRQTLALYERLVGSA